MSRQAAEAWRSNHCKRCAWLFLLHPVTAPLPLSRGDWYRPAARRKLAGLAFLGTQRATRHSFCLGGDPTKRWCPKASACSQPAGLCCWGSWEAVLSSALPSWAAVVCLLCLPLPWAESFPEAGTSSSCAPVRAWLSSGPVRGALTDEGVRQSHGQSAMGAPRRAVHRLFKHGLDPGLDNGGREKQEKQEVSSLCLTSTTAATPLREVTAPRGLQLKGPPHKTTILDQAVLRSLIGGSVSAPQQTCCTAPAL
nr:uncharacterized protein LOC123477914 [Desmodus rotundus]